MMPLHPVRQAGAVVHDPVAIEKLREIDPDGTMVRKWITSFLDDAPRRLGRRDRVRQ